MNPGKYQLKEVISAARGNEMSRDGLYLFFKDIDDLGADSDLFLDEIDVNDDDEEVYSDEIKGAGYNTFVNSEIIEDVVQNVYEKSDDQSLEFIIKALKYYIENDTFII